MQANQHLTEESSQAPPSLCTKCGLNPRARANFTWCRECQRKQQTAYRSRCIQSGLCTDCGSNPHRKGRRTCADCEAKKVPYRVNKRKQFKSKAVDYKGGCCFDCGLVTEYLDVYDFHHRDQAQKDLTIGHAMTRSLDWSVLQAELDKCDLLCANCHRIRHAKAGGTRLKNI